jgi:DNA-binding HxlR family transcriptional regulator
MDHEKLCTGTCPVARALAQVGDTWTMLILREAGLGSTRFDQFQKILEIAPNILTRRLAGLVEAGLLEKRRYSDRPPRDEYILTERGRDYLPILQALGAWGRKHFGEGPLSQTVDAVSGAVIDPVVVDRNTGRPLTDIDLRIVLPEINA